MRQNDNSDRDPLASWTKFGLPAFATALMPWQDKITEADLISDWYKPQITSIASLIGPLVCFCLWLSCDRISRRSLIKLCFSFLAILLSGLFGCLALIIVVDVYWFPSEIQGAIIKVTWPVLYLVLFAALAGTIVSGLLLQSRH